MNRIEQRFQQLRSEGKKGFIAYIGAGDPSLEATRELALAFDAAGVDVLELGVPFSDPLADGLVNQLAAQRGLASGTTPQMVLQTVSDIRHSSQIPIVLYLYFNLAHRVGFRTFIEKAAAAGVDGLLILDLPPEESESYEAWMRQSGMSPIYLVAPTTPEHRLAGIVKHGAGFVYYVSREGVTGMQKALPESLSARIRLIRSHTSLPVAVGFGISNPEQAQQVARLADAVVVGSAIVNQIARLGKTPGGPGQVAGFVKTLVQAVKHLSLHESEPEAR